MNRGISPKPGKIWIRALPLAIVLLAAALRFYHLGDKGLWGDEIAQANWALLAPGKLLARFLEPPDLILSFVWVRLAEQISASEFWVRLPSAMASVLAVPATYALARRLTDRSTAWLAMLLMALAPFQIWYAQDARMYAALCFYALLAFYFFVRLLDAPDRRAILGLAIGNALAAYDHFFGLFLPLIQFVALSGVLVRYRLRGEPRSLTLRRSVAFLLAMGLTLVLVVPLVPGVLGYVLNPTLRGTLENLFTHTPFQLTPAFLYALLTDFGMGPDGTWRTLSSLALGLVGTGVCLKQRPRTAWLALLWLGMPLLLLQIAAPERVVANRYLIFLQPVYLILIAVGSLWLYRAARVRLGRWWRRRVNPRTVESGYYSLAGAVLKGGLALLLLMSVFVPPLQALYGRAKLNDWKSIAVFLQERAEPGDVLIGEQDFGAVPALAYYLPNIEAYSTPVGSLASLTDAVKADRRMWYVSFGGFLNPAQETWVKQNLVQIAPSAWQRPDLRYDAHDGFVFTQSEALVTLYSREAELPARILYQEELGDRSRPTPYLELGPGQQMEARLQAKGGQARTLELTYASKGPASFEVRVNGSVVEEFAATTGGEGWRTARWRLADDTPSTVLVQIKNTHPEENLHLRSVAIRSSGF